MATGWVASIFKAKRAILTTSLKSTTTSFRIHCIIFILESILFLSINLDENHAEPNIGKVFKTNVIFITKYLNGKIHTFLKCIYYRAYSMVGIIIHLMCVKSVQLACN